MPDYYNEYLQDVYDPYGAVQRRAQRQALAQKAAQLPDLTPEQEGSLLQEVTGKAMGGLAYVGGALEKALGGRAIRGVLGGHPREALTLIPFSDTLGITDPGERVSGKDLLQQAGLLPKGDESWLGTGAGIATELALDPAMYLTFGGGALSEAGQVASKIGLLPATVAGRAEGTLAKAIAALPQAEQAQALTNAGFAAGRDVTPLLHEPLGGVAGLGLPFSHPSMLLGTGQAGADFARGVGNVAGKVANWGPLGYVNRKLIEPAGRVLTANFDPAVLGAVSKQGQEVGREATTLTRKLIEQARGKVADYATTLAAAGRTSPAAGAELRMGLEGVASPLGGVEQGVIQGLKGDYQSELQALQDLGVNLGELQDEAIQYAPRQLSQLEQGQIHRGAPMKALPSRDPRIEGREAIFKNLPGGTEAINRMGMDPRLSAATRIDPVTGATTTPLAAAEYIRSDYLGWNAATEQELNALRATGNADKARLDALRSIPGSKLTPANRALMQTLEQRLARLGQLQGQYDQSLGLANYMADVNPLVPAEGRSLFGNHPLSDTMTYLERTSRLRGAAEASHNLLAKTAIDTATAAAPPGSVPIRKVLEDAGLGTTTIDATTGLARGGQATLLKKLAEAGLVPPGTSDLAALDRFAVPAETAADLGRYMRGFTVPESVTPVIKAWDYLTNLTKAFQTAPFPGFHIRNWMSGLWQNYVVGGPGAVGRSLAAAKTLTEGGVIQGASQIPEFAARGLSDAQATAELGKEMFAFRAAGRGLAGTRDIVGVSGGAGQGLPELLNRIPGQNPESFATIAREAVPKSVAELNPLAIHGVGANTDVFSLMRAGRRAGDLVEDLNRGSLFIELRSQGYTAEQAAMQVRAAHFDYAALTPFEKNVMRRVAPFYTWTRHNIPFQLEQLVTKPGGLTASAIKAGASLRDREGFVPDYLGGGVALPLGQEKEGVQRYLTRLDLPFEQAFEPIQTGPKGLETTAMRLGGFLNPLIKGPIELATGKQLFTGRELGDLYSPLGSTFAEQLLMNSPLSRTYTTLKGLADTRKGLGIKGLNLLTGLKVSDVDVEKQRNIAARELIGEMLKGNQAVGRFETLYARPDQLTNLTPADAALLRLNKNLEQKAKVQAKEKRQAGK